MYFAVKKTLLIGGKRHMPCVCYELTNALIPTVKELVKKDWAFTSEKYMVFEGGKLINETKKVSKPVSKSVEVKEDKKAGF